MDGLTLDEAKKALHGGAKFGPVHSQLADPQDSEALKAFFVYGGKQVAPQQCGYTGDVCVTCGGARMVRTGTCLQCKDCGDTSGGCG